MYLYISSDNILILDQLRNSAGQLVDEADVIANIYRYDSFPIAENIPLAHIGVDTGRYEGVLPADAADELEKGVYYDVEIIADYAGTLTTFVCRVPAKFLCAC